VSQIKFSVGEGGANDKQDVGIVQYVFPSFVRLSWTEPGSMGRAFATSPRARRASKSCRWPTRWWRIQDSIRERSSDVCAASTERLKAAWVGCEIRTGGK
jgi:hypothetical protein